MTKPKVAAPPAAKPKFCTSKIREVVEVKVCGTALKSHPIKGEVCPNKDSHLFPMVTGFCNSGWCEGTKGVTENGKSAPTCRFFVNCPCECHARLNRMFDIAGTERVLVDHSNWKPDNPFVLPSMAFRVSPESFNDVGSDTPANIENAVPAAVSGGIQRTFAPTPSGRAGRGELESWVKEITDIWVVDQNGLCTPKYVSDYIARRKGIKAPSVGAVDAVLKRWVEIGFAVIEKKPTRFTGYTEAGIKFGLESMRNITKRVLMK